MNEVGGAASLPGVRPAASSADLDDRSQCDVVPRLEYSEPNGGRERLKGMRVTMRHGAAALACLVVVVSCGTAPTEIGGPTTVQAPTSTSLAPSDPTAGPVDDPFAPPTTAPAPTTQPPPPTTVPPVTTTPSYGEVPADLMAPVLEAAAAHSGVPIEQLEVIKADGVTWSDGSLGCPEPGMFYTQALVDGYWVIIGADGEELDYRLNTRGFFRLCAGGGVPPGAGNDA